MARPSDYVPTEEELPVRKAEAEVRKAEAEANKEVAVEEAPDRWILRIGVAMLGLIALAVVGGVLALKFHDSGTSIPDSLIAIGAGALGALAGILTPAFRK